MKKSTKSAFTLVEVLAGIVVISVISACSFVAVSTLFRGAQLSRNKTVAINLLQKSQEQIRKASLSFYDTLESCQFPAPLVAGTCGLPALGAEFNGFTRSVTTTHELNSTEIKRAVITVQWTDQGNIRKMHSAVLLARPPDPLPGSIFGTVRDSVTNDPIPGATVTVTHTVFGNVRATNSGPMGAKGANFDFVDISGAYVLPVGAYSLVADKDGYKHYPHPDAVIVSSNAETRVNPDILMERRPSDGWINVRLINGDTRAPLTSFRQGRVHILKDYQNTNNIINYFDGLSGTTRINFSDTNPQSFTVQTAWLYRSGYAGKTFKNGPPNCNYNYSLNGWSSAVMLDNTSTNFVCSNDWNGNSTTDRITVNPNQTVPVDIPLYPVPLATVKGTVINEDTGEPLAGAEVYAIWPPNGIDAYWGEAFWWKDGTWQGVITDASGNFNFTVPATQELFPNDASGYLRLEARKNMSYLGCCDTPQFAQRSGRTTVASNLTEGALVDSIVIKIKNGGPDSCGNVKGNLKDGFTGAVLNNAGVNIQSVGNSTDAIGDYIYQCPSTGYRLPTGLARFFAGKDNYYGYDSWGNWWYSPAPSVNIQPNAMANYDGKMWPVGYGTVKVHVHIAGQAFPIAGAQVKMTLYYGAETTIPTDVNGNATFNTTLETWPPVGLPADPYYFQGSRQHSLYTSHPSGTYSTDSRSIPILQKDDTITIDVPLVPAGGT